MLKKIVLILAVILTLCAGALYWIDSKIDKNEISKLIVQKIETTLVGTKAEILDLEYNLGFSLNFKITKLSVFDAKSKALVVGVDEASVKLNILSVLFGSGQIDVNIDSPKLNLIKVANGDLNLKNYLEVSNNSEKLKSKKIDTNNTKDAQLKVPNFIEKSSLNFKLTNFELNYKDTKVSTFKIDRIIIKDLGFKKTTAYELVSSIDYKIDKDNDVKFKVSLFGELLLIDIISNKSFNVNSYLYIKDITSTYLKGKIEDIETKINFSVDKESNIKSTIISKSKELINMDVAVSSNNEDLLIDINNLDLKIQKVVDFLQIEGLKAKNSMLVISGKIKSNLSFSKLLPDLNMTLSSPVTLDKMNNTYQVKTLSFGLKNNLTNIESTGAFLEGEYTISSNTKLDLLKIPKSIESLSKINTRLTYTNGTIPKDWLKLNLEPQKNTVDIKKDVPVKNNLNDLKLPITDTQIIVTNLKLDRSILNAKGKVKTYGNNIQSDNFTFALDDSNTNLTFSSNLNQVSDAKFNLVSKNLNLLSFNSFLPENLEKLTGLLNIRTSGNLKLSEKIDYNISGDVNAQNGSLKGLNLKDIISSFLGDLSRYLPKKELKISEEYEALNLSFLARPSNIIVKDLKIIGKNKSLDLLLKGNISELKTSELVGSLLVRDLVSDVKKLSNDGKLPLLLKGEGYILKPSISYTTSKLVKNKTNTEIQKAKSKLKDKAKDFFKGLNL